VPNPSVRGVFPEFTLGLLSGCSAWWLRIPVHTSGPFCSHSTRGTIGSAQGEGRGTCGRDRHAGGLSLSRLSSAGPPEDVGQVGPYWHRSCRRHASPPRVTGRVSADRRRRTAHEQPHDLAPHFAPVPRPPSGSEHRDVHSGVCPRPGLAQHVRVLEELPASVPVSPVSGILGFDEVRVDPLPDLIGHPTHQLSPFASARQRR
jgi:hypothetical protein